MKAYIGVFKDYQCVYRIGLSVDLSTHKEAKIIILNTLAGCMDKHYNPIDGEFIAWDYEK